VLELATVLQELREELVIGCQILDHQGVVDSSGHLSVRVPGSNTYLIPARGAAGLADAESILLMDENGETLDGSGPAPIEWAIHGGLYSERNDVNCILHSHSPMSRVFSISSVPLRPVYGIASSWFHEAIGVSGVVGAVSSPSAGNQLASDLGAASAILVRAHGSVVVGPSIEATTVRAITLEQVARSLWQALSIGPVEHLSEGELREWRTGGSGGDGKAWAYYRAQLGGRRVPSEPALRLEEEARAR
jgi:L-ribulose-5-phosphate 4-epimerase